MSEPLLPDGLSHALGEMLKSAEGATRLGLTRLAEGVETRAKLHASEGGAHKYGTPTTARKGSGPAVVSGDLLRSVTHSEIENTGQGFVTRVGPADIPHRTHAPKRPRSGAHKPAASSAEIGRYVEKMGYPWLTTAADDAFAVAEGLGMMLTELDW